VSIGMDCDFWREEVLSFGIHAYKCGFRKGFAFVSSLVRIINRDLRALDLSD